jgi:hypothetical protein
MLLPLCCNWVCVIACLLLCCVVALCRREFRRTPLIAGSRNTLAIDADGQVWSWGWNARGTLGHGHRWAEAGGRGMGVLTRAW